MQKIIFKDSTELLINSVIANNKYLNGENKEYYSIRFPSRNKTFEQVKDMFKDKSKLVEFDIFGEELIEMKEGTQFDWIYQGTTIGYTELSTISYILDTDSYLVEITKPNKFEQRLAENESCILELAKFVSTLLVGGN